MRKETAEIKLRKRSALILRIPETSYRQSVLRRRSQTGKRIGINSWQERIYDEKMDRMTDRPVGCTKGHYD
jgi:hypothetical protein